MMDLIDNLEDVLPYEVDTISSLCDDVLRLEQGEILHTEPSWEALDYGYKAPEKRRYRLPRHHSVGASLPKEEAKQKEDAPLLPMVIHAKKVEYVFEREQEAEEQAALKRLREKAAKRYPGILADRSSHEMMREAMSKVEELSKAEELSPLISEDIVAMFKERGPSPGLTAYRKFKYAEEGTKYAYDLTGQEAPELLFGPHIEAMEVAEAENVGSQGWLKSVIDKLKVDFGRWKDS
jgi:hypothetical protein